MKLTLYFFVEKDISRSNKIKIAKKLIQCTREQQEVFAEKLGIKQEWQEKQPNTTEEQNWVKILTSLGDKYTNNELIEALLDL